VAVTALEKRPHVKEVQIMSKTSKSAAGNTSKRRTRKVGGKSSRPAPPQRRTTTAASLRTPKVHSPALPARPSKKSAIVALLERPDGAAISDLTDATGWQVHSVRAALTGLRKEGKELVRAKDAAGVTHYRLAANA